MHFREVPDTPVRVIRVQREAARDTKRDPRESWFVWTDQEDIPLEQVRTCYRKRFSHEHGYRFLKQDLLWTQAHLRKSNAGVGSWPVLAISCCWPNISVRRFCVHGKASSVRSPRDRYVA